MASLQNRSGSYKLTFFYRGKRHYLTLGKVTDQEAEAKSSQVDYLSCGSSRSWSGSRPASRSRTSS